MGKHPNRRRHTELNKWDVILLNIPRNYWVTSKVSISDLIPINQLSMHDDLVSIITKHYRRNGFQTLPHYIYPKGEIDVLVIDYMRRQVGLVEVKTHYSDRMYGRALRQLDRAEGFLRRRGYTFIRLFYYNEVQKIV
jgi:hypothetical protein